MGNKVKNTTSVKLGIYETSTDTQLEGMLGDVKEMEDGRKFRLCHNSTAGVLAPGLLVQAKIDTSYTIDIVVPTTVVAGVYELSVTVTSGHEDLSINELKDGYFCVCSGSGELGHGRKIKANTAAANGSATTLTFYDKLTDSITSTSTGSWVYPIYKNVITCSTTGKVIGVPVCDVAASTATVPVFFWAQVVGACPVLGGGTVARGDDLISDDNGRVIVAAGTAAATVGTAMQTTADGKVGFVWLNLE